jgi:hypothetical protein
MVANSTASRKQKGRNLQQFVVATILKHFPALKPGDVLSTSMGAQGVDIKLSPAALEVLPIAIECKAQESLNLWSAWAQCTSNTNKELNPVLIVKRARQKPLAVVDLEYYMSLHADCDKLAKLILTNKRK